MKRLTTDTFIEKFISKYPDSLGLDLSAVHYRTAHQKVNVRCLAHDHQIFVTPDNLLHGIKACKFCKSENISVANGYTIDDFVSKAVAVHGNTYDYSETKWNGINYHVAIKCNIHGEFMQNPQSHWAGHGCLKCGYKSLRKTKEEFIQQAIEVHGNKYSYTEVEYVNNYTPVTIICPEHGVFQLDFRMHVLYKRGCPKCYPGNRSWTEIAWLDSLGIAEENRQKRLKINGKSFYVDAKVGNTVYEFWGDFWHGNPKQFILTDTNTKCNKTFAELYHNTMVKRDLILKAGYNLVEIWESDFLLEDASHLQRAPIEEYKEAK